MKVLHIIVGLAGGGAEATLFRLINSSHREVDHIVVSLIKKDKYSLKLSSLGIKILHLNMPRGKITFKGLKLLFIELKREKPDVVQTWMYHADLIGGVVARLAGCKKIFWGIRQSNLSPEVNKKSTILIAKLCAYVSHWVPNKIISCAQEAVFIHKKFGYKGNFILIPNGLDTNQFKPSVESRIKIREELGFTNEERLLGFVARWDPQKDHHNLLFALNILKKSHPNVRCVFAGTGCDMNNEILNNLIKKLNLQNNVILLGQRNDVNDLMTALDLHILASCGEAFPNVLAEAMSSGTPCVATDVGDASIIIGNTGWIVPPKDPVQLAHTIELALNEMKDDLIWEKRKFSCIERINKDFNLDKMVQSYLKHWSSED